MVSAFWAPDKAGTVHTGSLVSYNEGIVFTTAPVYSTQLEAGPSPQLVSMLAGYSPARPSALHGFTEDGIATLCQLVEIDYPGSTDYGASQSISATSYKASVAVMGMHLDGLEHGCLTSARYTFAGLNQWLPDAASEHWAEDHIAIKIPIKERNYLAFSLIPSRMQVTLKIFPELTSSEIDGARVSRSVAYVEVQGRAGEPLSWYLNIGNRLENLFSLLMGTSTAIETMFVYRGEESGRVITRKNSQPRAFNPLECVRCSPGQLARGIAIWLCEPPEFRSVEGIALGVSRKGKLFIETEFLSLAQALEGLHRVTIPVVAPDKATLRRVRKKFAILLKDPSIDAGLAERLCNSMSHANDPTFALRLHQLCHSIGDSLLSEMKINCEDFVPSVVKTRNFYTHTGTAESRRGKAALSISDIFLLNQKMRALLRGLLLQHIEIPASQWSELVKREATRWR